MAEKKKMADGDQAARPQVSAAEQQRMQEQSVSTLHDVLSLADDRRRSRRPASVTVVWIVLFLVAALVPYAVGRSIAVGHTSGLLAVLERFDPRGLALISWMDVTLAWITLLQSIVSRTHRRAGVVWLLVLFIIEQFLSGISLLKWNFWNSTYVVFHSRAIYANAINLGILASVVGAIVFCFVYVILLVFIRPRSKADFLTSTPAALSEYLILELIALIVVLFGGLITLTQ